MEIEKPQKTPNEFICITCDFKCCNKKDYNRHLSTRKHKWKSDGNVGNEKKTYNCNGCNKNFKTNSGLWKHKKICKLLQENTPKKENTPKEDERDKLINILFNDKKEMLEGRYRDMLEDRKEMLEDRKEMLEERKEMKELIILMVKSMQDVIPHVGGTNNTTNTAGDHNNLTNSQNTLNFYLTNTCKDAESLTEFTSRFCERIETFFTGNFQKIANNQEDLTKNVQEMFFECLEDKPQENKFIQTTDTKNGVYFVKEPNKVEKELTFGDSKFVKYKDGFEKTGDRIGHEISKVLQPSRNECMEEYKKQLVSKPKEEDYEDFDDYEKAKDEYHKSTGQVEENLMFQTYHAGNIFENKKTKEKVMSNTKRPKVEA
jgi:hypothetical protein